MKKAIIMLSYSFSIYLWPMDRPDPPCSAAVQEMNEINICPIMARVEVFASKSQPGNYAIELSWGGVDETFVGVDKIRAQVKERLSSENSSIVKGFLGWGTPLNSTFSDHSYILTYQIPAAEPFLITLPIFYNFNGYKQHPSNPCIFVKQKDGLQFNQMLHRMDSALTRIDSINSEVHGEVKVVEQNIKALTREYKYGESVLDLKNHIYNEWKIPVEQQIFLVAGKQVYNDYLLRDFCRKSALTRINLIIIDPK